MVHDRFFSTVLRYIHTELAIRRRTGKRRVSKTHLINQSLNYSIFIPLLVLFSSARNDQFMRFPKNIIISQPHYLFPQKLRHFTQMLLLPHFILLPQSIIQQMQTIWQWPGGWLGQDAVDLFEVNGRVTGGK